MHSLVRHSLFPWAWRLIGSHPSLPSLVTLAQGCYEPPDPLPAACVQAIVDDVQLPECRPVGAFPVRLLTANLCTGAGKNGPLQAQLEDAQVHVAFFQETRAKMSTSCDGRWLRFCAAAERGRGGCAIWINKAWKLGDCPIARHSCTVLLARADLLAVRLQFDGCSLLLANLHAPHSQHSSETIAAWWESATSQIRALLRGDCLIVGGDFNARVGPSSNCTGSHGPDFFDSAGTLASLFCMEHGFCLANTYEDVMGAHRPETWRDRRLDYVAVPTSCLGSCKIVDLEFDLLNPHEDHSALCLDFSVWGSLPAAAPRACPGSATRFRAAAGRDPDIALETLHGSASRGPSWKTNVHVHAEAIFHHVQTTLDSARTKRIIPRKPFTSRQTMEFIQARKHCDRALRQIDEQIRLACLESFFKNWRDGAECDIKTSARNHGRACLSRAACLRARSLWCGCVRRQVRLDKASYVEGLCLEFHQAALRKDSAALFAGLRFFRPASKRVFKPFGPLDVLKGPDGVVASSYKEQQMVRGSHFGAMEAALEQTASAFAATEELPTLPQERYQLQHLPTLLDVENVIRGLPRRKASGPSGVPNEVWRASPPTAARLWLPVLLKQHIRLTEPVRFSTGILATLFKGKGDPSEVSSHRSIFLLEGMGKACRKMIRLPLLDALRASSPDLFEGCQPGSSSEVLTHYIASFRDLHFLKGWSTACLFIDLSSAYYRVIRAKLVDSEWDDASICRVLAQMGVSPALFDSVRVWLQGGTVTSGMAQHHRHVLRAAFRSSGFLLRNLQSVFRARSGTRPGDSIADTLFALVFAEAMQVLRGRLQSQGLLGDVDNQLQAFPVWADDSVIPLAFPNAEALYEALPVFAATVHDVFAERAMSLNYGAGKTEALLRLTGSGSAVVRRRLLGRARTVAFVDAQGQGRDLRLCQKYTHLGTVLSEKGGPRSDFRAKLARAKQAVCPLAPKILRNFCIDSAARRHVLDAVGLSAVTHNVGIWHSCTAEEARIWDTGVADMYRLTLPADGHTGHPTFPCTHSAAGAAGFPSPAMLLVKQRVLHACRVVSQQRDHLWTYVASADEITPNSWLECLRGDLRLVETLTAEFPSPVPRRHEGPAADELFIWIAEHLSLLRRRVRQACLAQAHGLWQYALFQYNARQVGIRPAPGAPAGVEQWRCRLCAFVGGNYNAFSAHLFAAHKHRCAARRYVTGTSCRVCLTQFWSTARLVRHLAYSGTDCLLRLLCQPEPVCDYAPSEEAQHARLPAVRLAGPPLMAEALDLGCLASLLCDQPEEFAQLLLPSVQKHASELETLALANAFPFREGTIARQASAERCPTGKRLIQQYLS